MHIRCMHVPCVCTLGFKVSCPTLKERCTRIRLEPIIMMNRLVPQEKSWLWQPCDNLVIRRPFWLLEHCHDLLTTSFHGCKDQNLGFGMVSTCLQPSDLTTL